MAYVSFTMLVHSVRSGSALISFPTDTVPALASHPDHAQLIFQAKQRSTHKPLILMGSSADDLWPYVHGTDQEQRIWQEVAHRYWPGALTLVLPASDRIPVAMNPQNPTTLGIRVPNRAIARHILAHTGPLATTSVNRSGEPPLTTMEAINQVFPDVLTLSPRDIEELERSLLINPTSPSQLPSTPDISSHLASAMAMPSTVVQWTGAAWTVTRQGRINVAHLSKKLE